MKRLFTLVTVIMLAGCGGVVWFPDNSTQGGSAPTITSISPDHGIAGTNVTITGTNFSTTPASNIVKFNGIPAVVSSATDIQIVATAPAGVTTGKITVTVGSASATSAQSFSVSTTKLMGGAIQGNALSLTDTVTTLAGSPGVTSPFGVTTDGTNLYVTDTGDNTIKQIVIATKAVTTLAGNGSPGSADGTGTAATFSGPQGITTDGTNLYVADTGNNTIRKIVIATKAVTTLAGSGSPGSDNGTGAAASFSSPVGITTDGTNLYVADSANNMIRQIVIASKAVTTLAGNGSPGSADGTGTAATFSGPQGITTDGTILYVADSINGSVRQIEIATKAVTTLAAAAFSSPFGITTDGTNLYMTDIGNGTVWQIVIATKAVTPVDTTFTTPTGITTDGTGLYVADIGNSAVIKIE